MEPKKGLLFFSLFKRFDLEYISPEKNPYFKDCSAVVEQVQVSKEKAEFP